MYDTTTTDEKRTHPCPICGSEIPVEQQCCPGCEFLFLQQMGCR